MRERKSTAIKKQLVINELIKARGNTTIACENAGTARSTFYKWQIEDSHFAANIERIIMGVKNCAQDRVLASAMQDNLSSWTRVLKSAQRKLENHKNNL